MNTLFGRLLTVLVAAGAAFAVITAAPAGAHETYAEGPIRFVIGWGDEPTYTGFRNSVQVTITEATGAPVSDVGDELKVEVIKGTDKTMLPLVRSGTPGDYRAWLAPTRPGSYTFHLIGTVRGQKVDQTFTSSKTTFNDVEDVTGIAFPAKDPSTGQLATRIDREVPRLETALAEAEARAADARTLARTGVGIGVLGLLAAMSALVVARRRSGGTDAEPRRARQVSELARPNA